MRIRIVSILLVLSATAALLSAVSFAVLPAHASAAQQIDTAVPPGNPVVGSDLVGDTGTGDNTKYALWSLVAVCLIGAGVLLVTIERWEARRIEQAERAPLR